MLKKHPPLPPISIVQLSVGQMESNCYLLTDRRTGETLVVDPGDDAEYIIDQIEKLNARPTRIVATHGHFDHIMAAYALQITYNLPFAINERDAFLVGRMRKSARHFLGLGDIDPPPRVDQTLREGEYVAVGSSSLEVFATPGHTPGSISLYHKEGNALIVGDLLFAGGSVGRTDFSYSRPSDLEKSVGRILAFPLRTTLYPGHGPPTTVGAEKKLHHIKRL